jgi:hypothetical protein
MTPPRAPINPPGELRPPAQMYRITRCNETYICQIEPDGTCTLGPYGWMIERTGTGVYVVTHNLGHSRYVALVNLVAVDFHTFGGVSELTDNAITVSLFGTQNPADARFALVVFAA